ncbi:unnamed protein product [Adineta ricciae]|uniref:DYW domain-containing protein n=1 Tax=Adineta ricciae TaxID=249248 RepID=A0A815Q288_ADIRI|nr:unnamed protein product [Adineta ricciae]CAF1521528.1 unnamed protein product [Adineta ricciae]
MWRRSLNGGLPPLMAFVKRSTIIRFASNLGDRLKTLNDGKQFQQALQLFHQHQKNNNETLSSSAIAQGLKSCARLKDIRSGKAIHDLVSSRTKENEYIVTSLIHMYMQCGDIRSAETLFHGTETKVPSVYGAMMKGYLTNSEAQKAFEVFHEIQTPSEVNLIVFFQVCAVLKTQPALDAMKKMLQQTPTNFHSNHRLVTSLLNALVECGDVELAEKIFDSIKAKQLPMYGYIASNQAQKAIDLFKRIDRPDAIIINLLFNACAQLRTPEALSLVKQTYKNMSSSFYSNDYVTTSLLDALVKCGDTSTAKVVFSKMRRPVIAYANLMTGFNDQREGKQTMQLFYQMKREGLEPDIITSLCVIKALALTGDLSLIEETINQLPQSILLDTQIRNALIDMWGKTGCVDKAQEIYANISEPDAFTYTTMINSYGLNGMGMQALELFSQMPKEFIREVTYICILNACSHSGLVDEARSIFQTIESKTPTVWTTMVDCLARASLFDEAQTLIEEFERSHPAAMTMHMALLSGARNDKNAQLAQTICDRLKRLFPSTKDSLTAAKVLLANTYASCGDIGKASDIRIQLTKSGAKKKIGTSTTVVDGEIYEFRAHDTSHPRSDEIYREVQKISEELVAHGHEYDSSWITRTMGKDESVESVLCGHSERLAMAWNFVANPHAKRIQITKNLRVCGDCHRATKLIAAIRQCEIIQQEQKRDLIEVIVFFIREMPSLTSLVPFDWFEIHSKSRSPPLRVSHSTTVVAFSSIVYVLDEVNRVAFLVFKTWSCVPAYGSLTEQRHGHCLLSLDKERLYLQARAAHGGDSIETTSAFFIFGGLAASGQALNDT